MKFLVIGLGSIGTRHAKNLLAMGHEVVGYDIDKSKMEAAEQYGVKSMQTGRRLRHRDNHLMTGENFDASVICTPTLNHYADLVDAIHAGKHIFVEKPIAHRPDDIPGLLNAAKRKNLIIMVGNMLRFHPNVRLAKFMIKKPTKAIFQVLQKNERYKDSVILNWGAHEIDLALYLFGPAQIIDTVGTHKRATVTLEHDNGMTSVINMDYLTEPEVRRFEVDDGDMTHEIDLTLHDWNDIYIEEMKAFVGLIEGKSDSRCATGEDGLATLELIDAAERMAVTR